MIDELVVVLPDECKQSKEVQKTIGIIMKQFIIEKVYYLTQAMTQLTYTMMFEFIQKKDEKQKKDEHVIIIENKENGINIIKGKIDVNKKEITLEDNQLISIAPNERGNKEKEKKII